MTRSRFSESCLRTDQVFTRPSHQPGSSHQPRSSACSVHPESASFCVGWPIGLCCLRCLELLQPMICVSFEPRERSIRMRDSPVKFHLNKQFMALEGWEVEQICYTYDYSLYSVQLWQPDSPTSRQERGSCLMYFQRGTCS